MVAKKMPLLRRFAAIALAMEGLFTIATEGTYNITDDNLNLVYQEPSSNITSAYNSISNKNYTNNRSIYSDIFGLLMKTGNNIDVTTGLQSKLICDLTSYNPSSQLSAKDKEGAFSALGKQQKLYNLLRNIKETNLQTNFNAGSFLTKSQSSQKSDTQIFELANFIVANENSNKIGNIGNINDVAPTISYLGVLNNALTEIRNNTPIKITSSVILGKASDAANNNGSICARLKTDDTNSFDLANILYNITQIGSRGLKKDLIDTIVGNYTSDGTTLTPNLVQATTNILASLNCFNVVFGISDDIASANGSLYAQFQHLITDNALVKLIDSNNEIANKFISIIDKFNSEHPTDVNILMQMYKLLVPSEPISDAQSADYINGAINTLSLQECFYYYLSGYLTDSSKKNDLNARILNILIEIETIVEPEYKKIRKGLFVINKKLREIVEVVDENFEEFISDLSIAAFQASNKTELLDMIMEFSNIFGTVDSYDGIEEKKTDELLGSISDCLNEYYTRKDFLHYRENFITMLEGFYNFLNGGLVTAIEAYNETLISLDSEIREYYELSEPRTKITGIATAISNIKTNAENYTCKTDIIESFETLANKVKKFLENPNADLIGRLPESWEFLDLSLPCQIDDIINKRINVLSQVFARSEEQTETSRDPSMETSKGLLIEILNYFEKFPGKILKIADDIRLKNEAIPEWMNLFKAFHEKCKELIDEIITTTDFKSCQGVFNEAFSFLKQYPLESLWSRMDVALKTVEKSACNNSNPVNKFSRRLFLLFKKIHSIRNNLSGDGDWLPKNKENLKKILRELELYTEEIENQNSGLSFGEGYLENAGNLVENVYKILSELQTGILEWSYPYKCGNSSELLKRSGDYIGNILNSLRVLQKNVQEQSLNNDWAGDFELFEILNSLAAYIQRITDDMYEYLNNNDLQIECEICNVFIDYKNDFENMINVLSEIKEILENIGNFYLKDCEGCKREVAEVIECFERLENMAVAIKEKINKDLNKPLDKSGISEFLETLDGSEDFSLDSWNSSESWEAYIGKDPADIAEIAAVKIIGAFEEIANSIYKLAFNAEAPKDNWAMSRFKASSDVIVGFIDSIREEIEDVFNNSFLQIHTGEHFSNTFYGHLINTYYLFDFDSARQKIIDAIKYLNTKWESFENYRKELDYKVEAQAFYTSLQTFWKEIIESLIPRSPVSDLFDNLDTLKEKVCEIKDFWLNNNNMPNFFTEELLAEFMEESENYWDELIEKIDSEKENYLKCESCVSGAEKAKEIIKIFAVIKEKITNKADYDNSIDLEEMKDLLSNLNESILLISEDQCLDLTLYSEKDPMDLVEILMQKMCSYAEEIIKNLHRIEYKIFPIENELESLPCDILDFIEKFKEIIPGVYEKHLLNTFYTIELDYKKSSIESEINHIIGKFNESISIGKLLYEKERLFTLFYETKEFWDSIENIVSEEFFGDSENETWNRKKFLKKIKLSEQSEIEYDADLISLRIEILDLYYSVIQRITQLFVETADFNSLNEAIERVYFLISSEEELLDDPCADYWREALEELKEKKENYSKCSHCTMNINDLKTKLNALANINQKFEEQLNKDKNKPLSKAGICNLLEFLPTSGAGENLSIEYNNTDPRDLAEIISIDVVNYLENITNNLYNFALSMTGIFNSDNTRLIKERLQDFIESIEATIKDIYSQHLLNTYYFFDIDVAKQKVFNAIDYINTRWTSFKENNNYEIEAKMLYTSLRAFWKETIDNLIPKTPTYDFYERFDALKEMGYEHENFWDDSSNRPDFFTDELLIQFKEEEEGYFDELIEKIEREKENYLNCFHCNPTSLACIKEAVERFAGLAKHFKDYETEDFTLNDIKGLLDIESDGDSYGSDDFEANLEYEAVNLKNYFQNYFSMDPRDFIEIAVQDVVKYIKSVVQSIKKIKENFNRKDFNEEEIEFLKNFKNIAQKIVDSAATNVEKMIEDTYKYHLLNTYYTLNINLAIDDMVSEIEALAKKIKELLKNSNILVAELFSLTVDFFLGKTEETFEEWNTIFLNENKNNIKDLDIDSQLLLEKVYDLYDLIIQREVGQVQSTEFDRLSDKRELIFKYKEYLGENIDSYWDELIEFFNEEMKNYSKCSHCTVNINDLKTKLNALANINQKFEEQLNKDKNKPLSKAGICNLLEFLPTSGAGENLSIEYNNTDPRDLAEIISIDVVNYLENITNNLYNFALSMTGIFNSDNTRLIKERLRDFIESIEATIKDIYSQHLLNTYYFFDIDVAKQKVFNAIDYINTRWETFINGEIYNLGHDMGVFFNDLNTASYPINFEIPNQSNDIHDACALYNSIIWKIMKFFYEESEEFEKLFEIIEKASDYKEKIKAINNESEYDLNILIERISDKANDYSNCTNCVNAINKLKKIVNIFDTVTSKITGDIEKVYEALGKSKENTEKINELLEKLKEDTNVTTSLYENYTQKNPKYLAEIIILKISEYIKKIADCLINYAASLTNAMKNNETIEIQEEIIDVVKENIREIYSPHLFSTYYDLNLDNAVEKLNGSINEFQKRLNIIYTYEESLASYKKLVTDLFNETQDFFNKISISEVEILEEYKKFLEKFKDYLGRVYSFRKFVNESLNIETIVKKLILEEQSINSMLFKTDIYYNSIVQITMENLLKQSDIQITIEKQENLLKNLEFVWNFRNFGKVPIFNVSKDSSSESYKYEKTNELKDFSEMFSDFSENFISNIEDTSHWDNLITKLSEKIEDYSNYTDWICYTNELKKSLSAFNLIRYVFSLIEPIDPRYLLSENTSSTDTNSPNFFDMPENDDYINPNIAKLRTLFNELNEDFNIYSFERFINSLSNIVYGEDSEIEEFTENLVELSRIPEEYSEKDPRDFSEIAVKKIKRCIENILESINKFTKLINKKYGISEVDYSVFKNFIESIKNNTNNIFNKYILNTYYLFDLKSEKLYELLDILNEIINNFKCKPTDLFEFLLNFLNEEETRDWNSLNADLNLKSNLPRLNNESLDVYDTQMLINTGLLYNSVSDIFIQSKIQDLISGESKPNDIASIMEMREKICEYKLFLEENILEEFPEGASLCSFMVQCIEAIKETKEYWDELDEVLVKISSLKYIETDILEKYANIFAIAASSVKTKVENKYLNIPNTFNNIQNVLNAIGTSAMMADYEPEVLLRSVEVDVGQIKSVINFIKSEIKNALNLSIELDNAQEEIKVIDILITAVEAAVDRVSETSDILNKQSIFEAINSIVNLFREIIEDIVNKPIFNQQSIFEMIDTLMDIVKNVRNNTFNGMNVNTFVNILETKFSTIANNNILEIIKTVINDVFNSLDTSNIIQLVDIIKKEVKNGENTEISPGSEGEYGSYDSTDEESEVVENPFDIVRTSNLNILKEIAVDSDMLNTFTSTITTAIDNALNISDTGYVSINFREMDEFASVIETSITNAFRISDISNVQIDIKWADALANTIETTINKVINEANVFNEISIMQSDIKIVEILTNNVEIAANRNDGNGIRENLINLRSIMNAIELISSNNNYKILQADIESIGKFANVMKLTIDRWLSNQDSNDIQIIIEMIRILLSITNGIISDIISISNINDVKLELENINILPSIIKNAIEINDSSEFDDRLSLDEEDTFINTIITIIKNVFNTLDIFNGIQVAVIINRIESDINVIVQANVEIINALASLVEVAIKNAFDTSGYTQMDIEIVDNLVSIIKTTIEKTIENSTVPVNIEANLGNIGIWVSSIESIIKKALNASAVLDTLRTIQTNLYTINMLADKAYDSLEKCIIEEDIDKILGGYGETYLDFSKYSNFDFIDYVEIVINEMKKSIENVANSVYTLAFSLTLPPFNLQERVVVQISLGKFIEYMEKVKDYIEQNYYTYYQNSLNKAFNEIYDAWNLLNKRWQENAIHEFILFDDMWTKFKRINKCQELKESKELTDIQTKLNELKGKMKIVPKPSLSHDNNASYVELKEIWNEAYEIKVLCVDDFVSYHIESFLEELNRAIDDFSYCPDCIDFLKKLEKCKIDLYENVNRINKIIQDNSQNISTVNINEDNGGLNENADLREYIEEMNGELEWLLQTIDSLRMDPNSQSDPFTQTTNTLKKNLFSSSEKEELLNSIYIQSRKKIDDIIEYFINSNSNINEREILLDNLINRISIDTIKSNLNKLLEGIDEIISELEGEFSHLDILDESLDGLVNSAEIAVIIRTDGKLNSLINSTGVTSCALVDFTDINSYVNLESFVNSGEITSITRTDGSLNSLVNEDQITTIVEDLTNLTLESDINLIQGNLLNNSDNISLIKTELINLKNNYKITEKCEILNNFENSINNADIIDDLNNLKNSEIISEIKGKLEEFNKDEIIEYIKGEVAELNIKEIIKSEVQEKLEGLKNSEEIGEILSYLDGLSEDSLIDEIINSWKDLNYDVIREIRNSLNSLSKDTAIGEITEVLDTLTIDDTRVESAGITDLFTSISTELNNLITQINSIFELESFNIDDLNNCSILNLGTELRNLPLSSEVDIEEIEEAVNNLNDVINEVITKINSLKIDNNLINNIKININDLEIDESTINLIVADVVADPAALSEIEENIQNLEINSDDLSTVRSSIENLEIKDVDISYIKDLVGKEAFNTFSENIFKLNHDSIINDIKNDFENLISEDSISIILNELLGIISSYVIDLNNQIDLLDISEIIENIKYTIKNYVENSFDSLKDTPNLAKYLFDVDGISLFNELKDYMLNLFTEEIFNNLDQLNIDSNKKMRMKEVIKNQKIQCDSNISENADSIEYLLKNLIEGSKKTEIFTKLNSLYIGEDIENILNNAEECLKRELIDDLQGLKKYTEINEIIIDVEKSSFISEIVNANNKNIIIEKMNNLIFDKEQVVFSALDNLIDKNKVEEIKNSFKDLINNNKQNIFNKINEIKINEKVKGISIIKNISVNDLLFEFKKIAESQDLSNFKTNNFSITEPSVYSNYELDSENSIYSSMNPRDIIEILINKMITYVESISENLNVVINKISCNAEVDEFFSNDLDLVERAKKAKIQELEKKIKEIEELKAQIGQENVNEIISKLNDLLDDNIELETMINNSLLDCIQKIEQELSKINQSELEVLKALTEDIANVDEIDTKLQELLSDWTGREMESDADLFERQKDKIEELILVLEERFNDEEIANIERLIAMISTKDVDQIDEELSELIINWNRRKPGESDELLSARQQERIEQELSDIVDNKAKLNVLYLIANIGENERDLVVCTDIIDVELEKLLSDWETRRIDESNENLLTREKIKIREELDNLTEKEEKFSELIEIKERLENVNKIDAGLKELLGDEWMERKPDGENDENLLEREKNRIEEELTKAYKLNELMILILSNTENVNQIDIVLKNLFNGWNERDKDEALLLNKQARLEALRKIVILGETDSNNIAVYVGIIDTELRQLFISWEGQQEYESNMEFLIREKEAIYRELSSIIEMIEASGLEEGELEEQLEILRAQSESDEDLLIRQREKINQELSNAIRAINKLRELIKLTIDADILNQEESRIYEDYEGEIGDLQDLRNYLGLDDVNSSSEWFEKIVQKLADMAKTKAMLNGLKNIAGLCNIDVLNAPIYLNIVDSELKKLLGNDWIMRQDNEDDSDLFARQIEIIDDELSNLNRMKWFIRITENVDEIDDNLEDLFGSGWTTRESGESDENLLERQIEKIESELSTMINKMNGLNKLKMLMINTEKLNEANLVLKDLFGNWKGQESEINEKLLIDNIEKELEKIVFELYNIEYLQSTNNYIQSIYINPHQLNTYYLLGLVEAFEEITNKQISLEIASNDINNFYKIPIYTQKTIDFLEFVRQGVNYMENNTWPTNYQNPFSQDLKKFAFMALFLGISSGEDNYEFALWQEKFLKKFNELKIDSKYIEEAAKVNLLEASVLYDYIIRGVTLHFEQETSVSNVTAKADECYKFKEFWDEFKEFWEQNDDVIKTTEGENNPDNTENYHGSWKLRKINQQFIENIKNTYVYWDELYNNLIENIFPEKDKHLKNCDICKTEWDNEFKEYFANVINAINGIAEEIVKNKNRPLNETRIVQMLNEVSLNDSEEYSVDGLEEDFELQLENKNLIELEIAITHQIIRKLSSISDAIYTYVLSMDEPDSWEEKGTIDFFNAIKIRFQEIKENIPKMYKNHFLNTYYPLILDKIDDLVIEVERAINYLEEKWESFKEISEYKAYRQIVKRLFMAVKIPFISEERFFNSNMDNIFTTWHNVFLNRLRSLNHKYAEPASTTMLLETFRLYDLVLQRVTQVYAEKTDFENSARIKEKAFEYKELLSGEEFSGYWNGVNKITVKNYRSDVSAYWDWLINELNEKTEKHSNCEHCNEIKIYAQNIIKNIIAIDEKIKEQVKIDKNKPFNLSGLKGLLESLDSDYDSGGVSDFTKYSQVNPIDFIEIANLKIIPYINNIADSLYSFLLFTVAPPGEWDGTISPSRKLITSNFDSGSRTDSFLGAFEEKIKEIYRIHTLNTYYPLLLKYDYDPTINEALLDSTCGSVIARVANALNHIEAKWKSFEDCETQRARSQYLQELFEATKEYFEHQDMTKPTIRSTSNYFTDIRNVFNSMENFFEEQVVAN